MSDLEKIALFINGPNLHHTARRLGFDVDFKRLLARFGQYGSLVRAYYYTVVDEGGGPPGIKPLADWLDYNGFTVRSKLSKVTDDGQGRRKIRRQIGVELSVDAMGLARHVTRVFLFSGDGDLRSLVAALQRQGCQVALVSSTRTAPSMVADELRRRANAFNELDDLKDSIGRTLPTVIAQ